PAGKEIKNLVFTLNLIRNKFVSYERGKRPKKTCYQQGKTKCMTNCIPPEFEPLKKRIPKVHVGVISSV
ncbi:MAG: hypothetical protein ACM34B_11770, partial [Nitrospira sp.]